MGVIQAQVCQAVCFTKDRIAWAGPTPRGGVKGAPLRAERGVRGLQGVHSRRAGYLPPRGTRSSQQEVEVTKGGQGHKDH